VFNVFDFGSEVPGSNHTFCLTGKRTTEFTGILLSLHFHSFFHLQVIQDNLAALIFQVEMRALLML